MEDASIKDEFSWELYVDINPSNEIPLEGKCNAIARRGSLCFQNSLTENDRCWVSNALRCHRSFANLPELVACRS